MIRWVATGNDICQVALPLVPEPSADGTPAAAARTVFLFAAEHSDKELQLSLDLQGDEPLAGPPSLRVQTDTAGCRVQVLPGDSPTSFHVQLVVLPAPPPLDDDEVVIDLAGDTPDRVPACRVVVRRSLCRVSTALLDRPGKTVPLRPQTRAALLWYGWKRYRQVVGLKRFTTGLGGSDVLVFRPQLRDPEVRGELAAQAHLPGAICEAWGSCLLVKTGPADKAREEWDRFQIFLIDRLHPFMARSEAYLTVRPVEVAAASRGAGGPPAESAEAESAEAGEPPAPRQGSRAAVRAGSAEVQVPQATIIGSFLGGDLLSVEPFEQLVRGASDVERPLAVLRRLFSITSTWYAGWCTHPLGDWRRVLDSAEDGRLLLCGQFDLTRQEDRQQYAGALAWDIAFVKEDHLSRHWLGKNRDGLLYRLAQTSVRFSLTHGDLHPRNILVDRDNVWLIDFGVTGVAPSLFDFAKLEIYLRLWGLDLGPGVESFEAAAMRIETQLLDQMTGTESGLEAVREAAAGLGAQADDLLKISQCILEVRRQAMSYSLGGPDRSDYLAVLFLAAISTLRYAGTGSSPPANIRWLVGLVWVLEDLLSRLVGLEPFARGRAALKARQLLTRSWLAAPAAPGRIMYLLERDDGLRALEPLAATRGVLQNPSHHLDVFDHTLLVLAYLEALLADAVEPSRPIDAFLNANKLDLEVDADLRRQGIVLPPIQPPTSATASSTAASSARILTGEEPWLDDVQGRLRDVLTYEARLLLKWTALFHDVGKPATRCVSEAGSNRRAKVQFLGHELYGRKLVAEHLSHLFPEDDLRARMEHLIDKHHTHHQLANRYLRDSDNAKHLDELRRAAENDDVKNHELKFLSKYWEGGHAADFPLLILHGYADALACRGPDSDASMQQIAHLDLLLLALYFRQRTAGDQRTGGQQSRERQVELWLKGLSRELGMKAGREVGKLKKEVIAWYMEETSRRPAGAPEISREEVIDKARQLALERGQVERAPSLTLPARSAIHTE